MNIIRETAKIGKGKQFTGQYSGAMAYRKPAQPQRDKYALVALFHDARHLLQRCDVSSYDATTLEEVAAEMVALGNWVSYASWLNEVQCNLDLSDNGEKRLERQIGVAERGMLGSIERINAVKYNGKPLDAIAGIDETNGITPFLLLSNGRAYYMAWPFDDGYDNTLSYLDLQGAAKWGGSRFVDGTCINWDHPAVNAFSRLQQAQFAVNSLKHFPDVVKESVLYSELSEIGRSLLLKLAKKYMKAANARGTLTIDGLVVFLDGEPIKEVFGNRTGICG